MDARLWKETDFKCLETVSLEKGVHSV